jgi:hypothetical protein
MNRAASRRKARTHHMPNRAEQRDREIHARQADPAVAAAFKRALAPGPPSQIADALRRIALRRMGLTVPPSETELAHLQSQRANDAESFGSGIVLP